MTSAPPAAAAITAFTATAHFYSGDLEAAVDVGSVLLDGPLMPVEAAVPLCSSWAILGNPDRVLDTFDRALAAMPRGAEPPYFVFHNLPWCRLLALWQLGRLAEGIDPYLRFRQADVARVGVTSELATNFMPATYDLLAGHLDDAAARFHLYGEVLEVQPLHVATFLYLLIVALQAQRGELDAAEATLDRVRAYPPESRAGFPWWECRAEVLIDVSGRPRREGGVGEPRPGEPLSGTVLPRHHEPARRGAARPPRAGGRRLG